MKVIDLPIELRPKTGSAESRRLRRDGRLPANIYGLDRDPLALSIDAHSFGLEFERGHRVYDLKLDEREQIVLVKDIQYNALGDQMIHVDFERVDERKEVNVLIPLEVVGSPDHVSGASLEFVRQELEVSCLPRAIPAKVEVPVHELKAGGAVYAGEVELPGDVKLITSAEELIVHYHIKRGGVEEEAAEEGEEEATEPEVLTERKSEPEEE